jgi:hypothetical protein
VTRYLSFAKTQNGLGKHVSICSSMAFRMGRMAFETETNAIRLHGDKEPLVGETGSVTFYAARS